MKLNAKRMTLMISAIIVIFFTSIFIEAQTIQLTKDDKSQIISEILKQQKFEFEYPTVSGFNIKHKNTVYLSDANLDNIQILQIRNIKFEVITRNQINEHKKDGIQYYGFSNFNVGADSVKVNFGRYYEDAIRETNQFNTDPTVKLVEFICRKKSNHWEITRNILIYGPNDPENPARNFSRYDTSHR